MATYQKTAGKANAVARTLMALVPDSDKPAAAALIAQLVNLGFRCNPRAAHGTIRYNAVRWSVDGLPVKVKMEEVTDAKTGQKFNAIVATPIGGEPVTESADDAE